MVSPRGFDAGYQEVSSDFKRGDASCSEGELCGAPGVCGPRLYAVWFFLSAVHVAHLHAPTEHEGAHRGTGLSPVMCQKPNMTIEKPSSTIWEDLWSIVIWFYNLFLPTLKGTHACKPTMPAVGERLASNWRSPPAA